jgi:uncharacterized integral membrane protein (TIGR00697 family)
VAVEKHPVKHAAVEHPVNPRDSPRGEQTLPSHTTSFDKQMLPFIIRGLLFIITPFVHSILKINRFDFLVSLYTFCIIVSETYGAKTFALIATPWLTLNASVSIFLIPFIFTVNDVITEVYGKERARSVIRSSLVMIFLLLVVSVLFTLLPPSTRFAPYESAYDQVFGKSIRFAAASLVAFAVSDFLDVFIFARLRERFGKKRLWFRNNASNIISQFVDSFTFLTLAFYALNQSPAENFGFIFSLLVPYWLLRCALSVLQTPLVYWGVAWLKADKQSDFSQQINKSGNNA